MALKTKGKKIMQNYEIFEVEEQKNDSGIYPDLLAHLNLFNQVSKIILDYETEKTVLNIKLMGTR